MEARDLIVTPLFILIIYAVAIYVHTLIKDPVLKKYFIPALSVRLAGALLLGFIYQFYYDGGDTFNFHTHGSRHIWNAFLDNPRVGMDLLFGPDEYRLDIYRYASKIWYFGDPSSFFVVRVAAFFDLITFSSYSATALCFAVISFVGSWFFFLTFYRLYPSFHLWLAISCLFIPTVFFWGAGLLKDTLSLAALGIAVHAIYQLGVKKSLHFGWVLALLLSFFIIWQIKKYILLCFLPAALLWLYADRLKAIRSRAIKILIVPFSAILFLGFAYWAVDTIVEDDPRYSLDKIAETARITAYDIRYGWGSRFGEGSGYTLGELDGTWQSLIKLAPAAVNVSLFRPYLWEVRNPLMLLSALESLAFLLLTIFVLFKGRHRMLLYLTQRDVLFCLTFAVIFAFAVGVSTFNFGTLSRYKIPATPFYLTGIGLLYYHSGRSEKIQSDISIGFDN